jgi:hypothetical protein
MWLLLWISLTPAFASDGQVCLSEVLNKVLVPNLETRHQIQVDDQPKVDFKDVPKIVASGLSMERRHRLKIFWDGKVDQSWTFRFTAPMMNVFFRPGAWRMSKNPSGQCQR